MAVYNKVVLIRKSSELKDRLAGYHLYEVTCGRCDGTVQKWGVRETLERNRAHSRCKPVPKAENTLQGWADIIMKKR